MKLNLLSLLIVSFLLVFSLGRIAGASDDGFYPSDDSGDGDFYPPDDGFYPPDDSTSPSDGDIYPPDDGDFYPADDDFYPPADDDDFYPQSDDDFYPSSDGGGDGGGDDGSDDGGSTPPSNNPPVITSFSVPATAYRNTDMTLTVTADDSDGGINRIELLYANSTIVSLQSCSNVISCTRSFIVRAPDAFSMVYTFMAMVFDTSGASATASASGITHSDYAPSPYPPEPTEVLDDVRVKIPASDIFVSSIVPDTSCLSPGTETYVYVSLSNRGSKTLKDVKMTAIVEELGIRAVSGPFRISKDGGSASRFLDFYVPEGVEEGDYYIRVSVTSEMDSIVKYRVFEVNRAC